MQTGILRYGAAFILMLILPSWLSAQCSHHGFVVDGSAVGGCGLLILTENGEVFELPENPYQLEPGEEIYFSYQQASGSSGCQMGELVHLDCVEWLPGGGNGYLCDASFAFSVESLPSLTANFQSNINLPDLYSYNWDFGIAMGSSEVNPTMEFPSPGDYQVCLTISDNQGCENTYCEMITVGALGPNCGYEVDVQVSGLTIHGEIYNVTDFGPDHPQSVVWVNEETGEILSSSPVFDYTYSDPSECGTICVGYVAEFPGNESCWGDICVDLSIPDGCVDPEKIDPEVICPTVEIPVCGCDGVTYENECQAEYLGGVTDWTEGPCPWSQDCQAYFVSWTDGFNVYLADASTFSTSSITYHMGDGAVYNNQISVAHIYQEEGWYTVCMDVESYTGCQSTYCEEIYVGNPFYMCDANMDMDCVWPGDANGDGMANHYDVLQMALSYDVYGFDREDANLDWDAQYAVDWGLHNQNAIDFKHSDSNGDGKINMEDSEAIELHYEAAFDQPMLTNENAPLVYVEFDIDTLVFDSSSPEFMEVTAGIYIGQPDKPVLDAHGLALQLYYPQTEITLPHSITTSAEAGTFFGESNELVTFQKEHYNLKRLDFAISRNDRVGANGFGRAAEVNYIIVGDIIGGRSEQYIPFTVQLEGVKLLGPNGEEMEFDLPTDPAGFTIVNNMTTTDLADVTLSDQVKLFPNPVKDKLTIQLGDLSAEYLEVYNTAGQRLLWQSVTDQQHEMDLGHMASGIYLLKIQTDQGLVHKRVVIE